MRGPGAGSALRAFALLCVVAACARGDDGWWSFPAESVAWWGVDPSAMPGGALDDANRALVEGSLRWAVGSRAIDRTGLGRVIGALATPTAIGPASAYRVCVLEIAGRAAGAGPAEADEDAPIVLDRLIGVVEVRCAGGTEGAGVVARVRAALDGLLPGGTVEEGTIAGRRGARWSGARGERAAWVVDGAVVTIGCGEGALERWFAPRGRDDTPWRNHAEAVEQQRSGHAAVLAAYVSVNGVRRGVPDAFGEGEASRLLSAWRLSNARDVYVRATLIGATGVRVIGGEGGERYDGPPLVAIDAVWSARSWEPGRIRGTPLSAGVWPVGDLGAARAGLSYAVVIPVAWASWVGLGLDTAGALGLRAERESFASARETWTRRHQGALNRVVAGAGRLIVLEAESGGGVRVWAPLKGSGDPRAVVTGLREALAMLSGLVERSSDGEALTWRWSLRGAWSGLVLRWTADARNSPGRLEGAWE